MISPVSNSESQNSAEPLSPAIVSMINRLANKCRDAARTTQQAMDLTIDPAFKVWLEQLREVHEGSVAEFESVLESRNGEIRPRHSFGSRVRRWWMRCADAMTAGAPLALMDVCRREEYRVQAAYELALWIMPSGVARDVVEQRFQQFVLHRSMIPARRLPKTEQFLTQADRLQKIHSAETDVAAMDQPEKPSEKFRPAAKSNRLPAGASPAINSNGSRYVPGRMSAER